MFKNQLQLAAILAFSLALILTAFGGFADMTGQSYFFTKQHAWNDGVFLMLVAIFLLGLAKL
jgi:hypothetical protein